MTRYKYPRTPHLSWSPGFSSDDIILADNIFSGREVVITEKLDGENTSIYCDYIHARSINSGKHQSRDWVNSLWGSIKEDIPEGYRICGENLYAKHSIKYFNLESYFYVFSIWNGDECLSWNDTLEYCSLLNLSHVPVLYEGVFSEEVLPTLDFDKQEGYVVRLKEGFSLADFGSSVAKYVRKNHVQTDKHWLHKKVEKNLLRC